ncbi:helix-turn-helix domain-containing protein [Candidatus Moduliflexota bacterium]
MSVVSSMPSSICGPRFTEHEKRTEDKEMPPTDSTPTDSKYLTSEQVADLLRRKQETVWAMCREGRIPYRRFPGQKREYIFIASEIEAWIDSFEGKTADEVIEQMETRTENKGEVDE